MQRLRRANSVDWCGQFERFPTALDNLVIEHLDTVRMLARMGDRDAMYCRMVVEGYSRKDMAAAMGCSERTVLRVEDRMRLTMTRMALADALGQA